MQRLFSMFPRGLPGLALALLRASVGVALLLEVYGHPQAQPGWAQGVAIALAATLCAGYLTPIVAVLGLAFHGLIWTDLGVDSVAVAMIVCLDAVVLALLGPGAYSVDSYFFGRRVVVLPPP